ncbi:hypothetical protein EJ04DRAFT_485533 [Polyplosphaeria fusca]|uniref:DUF3253 domain-containing protein n=1 Tax=Polyplosphaeria fusca TaxID=682080 RepID=A0A9P4V7Q3_9PLEO|nr:hypothetical protein EJ04DRAFT_485533 [Polyplosphaeria fusca]
MPLDEMQVAIVEAKLTGLMEKRVWPKTLCPSEVARAFTIEELGELGAGQWRDVMGGVREVAWEMRDRGDLEILQKGEVIGASVSADHINGPIRLRKPGNAA